MKLRIFLPIFLVITLFSAKIFAQDEGLTAAIKLMEISGARENMEAISTQTLEIQIQQMPALAPYRRIMEEWNEKYLGFDAIKNELAEIYLDHFSLEEINGLIEFYETDLGQKSVKALPDIFVQSSQVGISVAETYAPELEKMIAAEAQRIQSLQQE